MLSGLVLLLCCLSWLSAFQQPGIVTPGYLPPATHLPRKLPNAAGQDLALLVLGFSLVTASRPQ